MNQARRMAVMAAATIMATTVAACGSGGADITNNTAYSEETPTENDVSLDALNGTDANMGAIDNAVDSVGNVVDASGEEAEPVRRKKRP